MKEFTRRRDFFAGSLMLLIGLGTIIESLNYSINNISRMGAGYFPLILGCALVFTSILIVATSKPLEEQKAEVSIRPRLRPWLLITSGLLFFMVFGKYGGLVPATFVLVFLCALGDRNNSVRISLILAATMSLMAAVVFHYGLQIPFPLFRWG